MKKTLESMDKLQADLDEAFTFNLGLENQTKFAGDQVALLQYQVSNLQAQAEGARTVSMKVAELLMELKEIVAQGGEMSIQG